jgi:hypothetical protein
MIRRLAFCLTLLPALAMAKTAHQPTPPPPVMPLTPPAMCEAAIDAAEAAAKLPARVLTSIALRESGRVDPDTGRVRPWPWTINYEGAGHFYASKDEAIAAVQQIQAGGGQSVDVGCMQVNLQQHPEAFLTLDDAFDPQRNATYAARFLTSLFASLSDWGTAIAAYHSRTPGIGEPYRDQVVATWNPKDPAVLARLSFQPLPPRAGPVATMPLSGLPTVYVPFAQPGPIQISANMAYRAFVPPASAYQAFKPMTVAYGDFAQKRIAPIAKARGRPLDLRIDQSLMSSGRDLVVPKGIIERSFVKPAAVKTAAQRPRQNG